MDRSTMFAGLAFRCRAWFLLAGFLAWMSLVAGLLEGCGATARANARGANNAMAELSDDAGQSVLEGFCAAQMAAIGRTGHWRAGHCEQSGERAGTAATHEELGALLAVRQSWRRVIAAHDAWAHSLDAYRAALDGADAISEDRINDLLVAVLRAFGALRSAASDVGVVISSGGEQ
jgi:hypothetical protein